MNYIVRETVNCEDASCELVHPFNDFGHACKMARSCADSMTSEDILSFFAIDDEGNTFDLPIF